ncbi:hypothetical protein FOZ63_029483 [Perkinsus olseni]|uniref:Uncharacterized protein n=1 Tax=Perkinsus olseni TaxID=32597 RepID=A0A7J6RZF4_PEROL|nr:hypothetical protein FOZ63_029483 [Perkinsus olseni]KAF4747411.1 hypothetical protein FOZ62_012665 [Perkinsus olseni]
MSLAALLSLPPVTGAAVVTAVTLYPVDIVRAMAMSQASGVKTSVPNLMKDFYHAHGMKGFVSKGIGAEMARATFSRSIKFWLQPICHKMLFGKKQSEGTSFTKGVAGGVATIPEMVVISPFENAKLAMQLDATGRFKSTADVLSHLWKTRGFSGFYLGFGGMQMRQFVWSAGYFMSLDKCKQFTRRVFGKDSTLSDSVAGFGAGVFGVVLNCWTDVVRTVIQKNAITETFNPAVARPKLTPGYFVSGASDVFRTAADIYAARGFSGLYAGFAVKSVYLGCSGALLAVLVPRFKMMWGCQLALSTAHCETGLAWGDTT